MNTGEMTATRRAPRPVPPRLLAASLVAMSIAFGALLPASAGAVAAAGPGTLDRAFGQGGRVVEDFGTEPAREGEAEQAIPTADGGLLVLSRASITKFLPDGSVDRGFGRDGAIVRIEGPIVMTTDSQGRIVVVSSEEDPAGSVTLERFEPDGGLDRSFGAAGSRRVKIARNRMGSIKALLTQPDGKLLLVGSGYAFKGETEAIGAIRLLPSGAVDRGYGSGGCASFTLPLVNTSWPKPVATLDGEDLVLAAYSAKFYGEPSFLAVRFDGAGNLDPGFGDGGVVHDNLVEGPADIAVGADGRLTVVGGNGTTLGRLLPDGTPDPSFGKEGTLAEALSRRYGTAMTLEANGSILIAASTETNDIVLERRLPDGSPDPSFGGGQGYVSIGFASDDPREVQAHGLVPIPGRGTLVYGTAPANGEPGSPRQIAAVLFGPNGEPVQGFDSGGALLSRPLVASDDVGSDLLAGNDGVTVTGRVGGEALLRRFQPDGSVDRRFRSGRPTLPPSGAYLGDEGNVLSAAAGGGFFLGTGSSAGGDVYRFRHNGSLRAGFSQDGVAHVEGLSRILDVAPAKGGSNYVLGISYGACSLELGRLRPTGALDPNFGGRGGLRRIAYGSGPCTFHDIGLAPRRDGAVVVAGEISEGILGEYGSSGQRLELRRRHPLYLGRSERRRAFALDRRGRILLVGRFKHSLTVTRLTPSGRRDRSFGRDGVARVNVGRFAEGADLALEPDGKVAVAGRAELCPAHTDCHGSSALVARLNPDGHLDRSFASAGVWTGKPGEASGLNTLALAPDAIYATGWSSRPHRARDLLLLRLRR
jgi:uncharacterized delta-60 repeat protein